jgi:predicted phosphate transport protein (TIGR00153 family)
MAFRLIPRDVKFFDLFVADGDNLALAAERLAELVDHYDRLDERIAEIQALEKRGDELDHEINAKLEDAFVTPFDREDIHQLISRLDDVLDFIEEVADTCILYKIEEPSSTALAQAEIIVKQTEEIVRALEKLKGFKGVGAHWIEIHRLENEGDRVVRQAMADLFTNGVDAVEIIRWKDLYALLEDTIDSCEDVANVIERIVVKHA